MQSFNPFNTGATPVQELASTREQEGATATAGLEALGLLAGTALVAVAEAT